MASARGVSLYKSVLVVGAVVLVGISTWAYQNRDTLIAACLNTVGGLTSKVAHLNKPFGLGSTVEPKNPVVGIVPEFTLTEQHGRAVGKADLLGSFWVASFIFTRCVTTCPHTVATLSELQSELPKAVRLVSFSVDPNHDTPDVLDEYAKSAGADLDRWLFLTGDQEAMYRYIREGFLLAVEENDDGNPGWEVTHSPRFALVDPKGRIRGYYDSSDEEDVARLRSDVLRLYERSNGG